MALVEKEARIVQLQSELEQLNQRHTNVSATSAKEEQTQHARILTEKEKQISELHFEQVKYQSQISQLESQLRELKLQLDLHKNSQTESTNEGLIVH